MKENKKHTKTTNESIMNYYSTVKSPIGELMLVADDSALTGLYFVGRKHIPAASKQWTLNVEHTILRQVAKQLQEYFAGKRTEFSLPVHLSGTDFQEKIWR
jgi:methylated-DNA-[protein]-cysteine S-methyltransferase